MGGSISEIAGLAPRLLAARRLRQVLAGAPFVPVSAAEIADARDRALTNRLVTLALRRHGHIDHIIARLLARGLPRSAGLFEAVLRIGLAELLFDDGAGAHAALFLAVEIAKSDGRAARHHGLLNAVLRNAQRQKQALAALPVDLLFPDWIRRRWQARYGEVALAAFAAALLDGAELDLSVKPGVATGELGGVEVLENSWRLSARDRTVADLPGYERGDWWVQDVGASLAARTMRLGPQARVLDLCAAPGGKTAQLVLGGYHVTALDNDTERLERLKTNMGRLRLQVETLDADAASFSDAAGFDGILIDAPCTATGTFRRHPEVLWNRTLEDVGHRAALQRRIVDNAVRSLKPGGQLVYCTCSLEPEEGEDLAKALERPDSGLTPMPIQASEVGEFEEAITGNGWVRTHPGMRLPGGAERLDGFFVARFVRNDQV